MERPIVITGIGDIGPYGLGSGKLWEALLSGQSQIHRLTRFDPQGYASQIGGEVVDECFTDLVDPRAMRTVPHVTQIALAAAQLAKADSGLADVINNPWEIGVAIGTALGGWTQGEQQYGILLERGARRVNPFLVSGSGNHGAGIEVATAVGAAGPHLTLSSGCPSALQAISTGQQMISKSEVLACYAGGAESPLSPMVMAALARTNELSTRNETPGTASRPFDRQHDGMVLSEGACLLVLESEDHARNRGARVYAEVLGGTSSCDAKGLYHFDESGEAGARAIHLLLKKTGVTPDQIDYVCAHANSSPAFDRKEVLVLKKAFGEFAAKIPVSSIKGVIGHPFGASGAFQTAAAAMAMQHSLIPPTHNLEDPDPECDLDLVMGEARPATIRHALITSYGYGGVNAFLLLRNPNL